MSKVYTGYQRLSRGARPGYTGRRPRRPDNERQNREKTFRAGHNRDRKPRMKNQMHTVENEAQAVNQENPNEKLFLFCF